MDVRRSGIPCRNTRSVPDRIPRGVKSPKADEVIKSDVSVYSSTQVRRTTNSVSQRDTEIRKTPNSAAASKTKREVRKTGDAVASVETQSSAARGLTSASRQASRGVSSITTSISRLSTSASPSGSPLAKGEVGKAERKGSDVAEGMEACKVCGRTFAQERIQRHLDICSKTGKKRRKPFDPVKHRLQGTDAQTYLNKPTRPSPPTPNKNKKTNWRKKHEEFISIVRAAREVQAHLAKGGKLSDLPAAPSLSTDDLTQCPHCKRKFSEAAAERHIPKCANIRSNKPPARSQPRKKI